MLPPIFIDFHAAVETVLQLARASAATPQEHTACDTVEDFVVNHLGDD